MNGSMVSRGESRFILWTLALIIVLSFLLAVLDQRSNQDRRVIPAAAKP